jgi:hypothetical protein
MTLTPTPSTLIFGTGAIASTHARTVKCGLLLSGVELCVCFFSCCRTDRLRTSQRVPLKCLIFPGMTYEVDGPFDTAGGFVVGSPHIQRIARPRRPLSTSHHYTDQGGWEPSVRVNDYELDTGGSSNPGPTYFKNTGIVGISESNSFTEVPALFGVP